MNVLKKAFLYFVGAIAVAYEEATKAVRNQQTNRDGKAKEAIKAKA